MSQIEDYIGSILFQEHIHFEREKQIKDLRNGLYRFDFYVPSKHAFIEINGLQHYIYTPHFHKSKSDFLKAKERDRRKIAYCLARGIKLYIIPYWDKEKILKSSDIFQDQYLARTKFHNDEMARSHFS